jgi:hypothetical protein
MQVGGHPPPAKEGSGCNPQRIFEILPAKPCILVQVLDDVSLHVIMSKKDMNTVYRFCIQM